MRSHNMQRPVDLTFCVIKNHSSRRAHQQQESCLGPIQSDLWLTDLQKSAFLACGYKTRSQTIHRTLHQSKISQKKARHQIFAKQLRRTPPLPTTRLQPPSHQNHSQPVERLRVIVSSRPVQNDCRVALVGNFGGVGDVGDDLWRYENSVSSVGQGVAEVGSTCILIPTDVLTFTVYS